MALRPQPRNRGKLRLLSSVGWGMSLPVAAAEVLCLLFWWGVLFCCFFLQFRLTSPAPSVLLLVAHQQHRPLTCPATLPPSLPCLGFDAVVDRIAALYRAHFTAAGSKEGRSPSSCIARLSTIHRRGIRRAFVDDCRRHDASAVHRVPRHHDGRIG
jgi:hypothetical protein